MKRDAVMGVFDLERPDFNYLEKLGVHNKEVAWQDGYVYILFYTGRIPSKSTIIKLLIDNGFEIGTEYGELLI